MGRFSIHSDSYPQDGVYIALVIGVYEFVMAVLTLGGAELIPVLSVSHWTLQLIDSIVLIVCQTLH